MADDNQAAENPMAVPARDDDPVSDAEAEAAAERAADEAEEEHDAAPPQDPPLQDDELPEDQQEDEASKEEEASKEVRPLDPVEANPIKGAHLGMVEGAVDLSRYPDVAESVQDKLEESFESGEDVKQ